MKSKGKQEQEFKETQHEPKVVAANESKKPGIIGIFAGILVIVMIVSIIWMAAILVSGGPEGVLQTWVTIIGGISTLLMLASAFT